MALGDASSLWAHRMAKAVPFGGDHTVKWVFPFPYPRKVSDLGEGRGREERPKCSVVTPQGH